MWSKKSINLFSLFVSLNLGHLALAQSFSAEDADHQTIVLNPKGHISLVVNTNEDTQDLARQAGEAVYPFQGRPDFQLVVVIDLRDSIANWAPSITLAEIRSNLDDEARQLRPYYQKNHNNQDPRLYLYAVADFKGKISQSLGWNETSSYLRAKLFGTDGQVLREWSEIDHPELLRQATAQALKISHP